MKIAVRVLVFGMLGMILWLSYQLKRFDGHYEALVGQLLSVAANSYFTGCMVDKTADADRASYCKEKTFKFLDDLATAIGEKPGR